ncbi:hypothetical protein ACLOJK_033856 [Asimina triloba]
MSTLTRSTSKNHTEKIILGEMSVSLHMNATIAPPNNPNNIDILAPRTNAPEPALFAWGGDAVPKGGMDMLGNDGTELGAGAGGKESSVEGSGSDNIVGEGGVADDVGGEDGANAVEGFGEGVVDWEGLAMGEAAISVGDDEGIGGISVEEGAGAGPCAMMHGDRNARAMVRTNAACLKAMPFCSGFSLSCSVFSLSCCHSSS